MRVVHNNYSVAAYWGGGFEESALQEWATDLRRQLKAPRVSLGLVFMTEKFFPHAGEVLELLRVHAQVPLLAGCSSTSLIAGGEELEEQAGLVLGLYHLPGATLQPYRFTQKELDDAFGPSYWHMETNVRPDQTNGWLAFADPYMDVEGWLRGWNEAYPTVPVVGGLASGDFKAKSIQVYLDGQAYDDGGVAIGIGGDVSVCTVISQGCTPIGDTWTITRAEQHLIHQIGNRPAYAVLADTYNQLTAEEQRKARGNLFIGLATNEYLEEFHRGDFLIRNLLGADPISGTLAVGAFPRMGQTIQFQRRDAVASSNDITALLTRSHDQLASKTIYGGCLCTCNGRGHRLFGKPHHDAAHVQKALGPIGLAGCFCNGEIGPVGSKSYLHGYTASLALFVNKG
jgi:small ligand-binding sensory domain FIST